MCVVPLYGARTVKGTEIERAGSSRRERVGVGKIETASTNRRSYTQRSRSAVRSLAGSEHLLAPRCDVAAKHAAEQGHRIPIAVHDARLSHSVRVTAAEIKRGQFGRTEREVDRLFIGAPARSDAIGHAEGERSATLRQ